MPASDDVPSRKLIVAPRAASRLAAARSWLEALPPATEALVVAPTQEAADELVRAITLRRGAIFGIQRLSFTRLAALLAAPYTAAQGLTYVDGLGARAVAARALFALRETDALAPLGEVADLPGLPKAIAATRLELSHARLDLRQLSATNEMGRTLAAIFAEYDAQLRRGQLIDRAGILEAAIAALAAAELPPYAGFPTVLLDLPLDNLLERDFVRALAARAPALIATAPSATSGVQPPQGDSARHLRAVNFLSGALAAAPERISPPAAPNALARVQEYLFGDTPPLAPLDDSVALCSAAGEMQECVEIARQIHAYARRGVPFDRIAILLHTPGRYAAYLEEALTRAQIPAWFARGARRPEPGGRALLALLNCLAERFSARRFAEYLSLSQMPDPDALAAGNSDAPGFVPATAELLPTVLDQLNTVSDVSPEPDPTPLPGQPGRAPWRWERLLLEASIVAGHERWHTRLAGLERELQLRRRELKDDDSRCAKLDRDLADLEHLSAVALPIIGLLAALPLSATWREWLDGLRALTALAIRDSQVVLIALAELEPMGPIGGVTLDEVRIVLSERLGHLEKPPPARRYGAVFVAPTNYAYGLEFDITLIPGLAERLFPRKLIEDPLLPDHVRVQLGNALPVQSDRAEAERTALRVALGAASRSTSISYPRLDVDQGRPRVPSFYALEILRAAEGQLPGFDELARRAAGEHRARLGWPVPQDPAGAIDTIEFDLATLDQVVGADAETTRGAAHYLLDANPHLRRALRARARRWLRRWTPNDGFVDPAAAELEALAQHQLAARSYSPTALQHYAACPFKFFLQAIVRLEPRDEIQQLEAIDPLTRGALFHEVQFETLTALRELDALPVRPSGLDRAFDLLEQKLSSVSDHYRDELAPAIERVWLDGIDSIRADLREWMRRMADDPDGFCPDRFELSFGLDDRLKADPASVATPVKLPIGINLRGSIDLIERGADGTLRVTDHKTGRAYAGKNFLIGGGKTLQPILYALAAEQLLEAKIASGRLYYCTAAGNYESRVVPLDDAAREAIALFAANIDRALTQGFFPSAPADRQCDYCDYRPACGPYEQTRVKLKSATAGAQARLADLIHLREMR
jgi:RecB family exonuclease